MGKKSHITKATTTSNSLRAIIPVDVAKDMDLNIGDILDWEVHASKRQDICQG